MSLRLNGMEVFLHEMDTAIAYGDITDYSEYVDLFTEKHGYSDKTKSNLKANELSRERFDNRVALLKSINTHERRTE